MHRPSSLAIASRTSLALVAVIAGCSVIDKGTITFDDRPFEDDGSGGTSMGGGGGGLGGETGSGGGAATGGSGTGGSSTGCEAAAMRCDGRQVQICAGNSWVSVGGVCENACINGVCGGVCVPDSKECITNRTIQTCNDEGEWVPSTCPENTACIDAENECGGECEPGDRDCQGGAATGNHVRVCDDSGAWVDNPSACPDECTSGVCVGCTDVTQRQCVSPTQYQQCDGASWGASQTCSFACVGSDCGGVCVPGARQCAAGNNFQFQVCSNEGQWGAASSCSNQACTGAGACVGVCQPGAQRCSGTAIEVCSASGEWEQSSDCEKEGLSCVSYEGTPFCGECSPGSSRCSPDEYNTTESCNTKGLWGRPTACEEKTLCYAGECLAERDFERLCSIASRARGCVSATTRWYCSLGAPETAACARGQTCNPATGSCALSTEL